MKPGEVFRVGTKVYERSADGPWPNLPSIPNGIEGGRVGMFTGKNPRKGPTIFGPLWFDVCIADCTTEDAAEAALRLNRLPDGPEVQR